MRKLLFICILALWLLMGVDRERVYAETLESPSPVQEQVPVAPAPVSPAPIVPAPGEALPPAESKPEPLSSEPITLLEGRTVMTTERVRPITLQQALNYAERQNLSIQIQDTRTLQEKWRLLNNLTAYLPTANPFYNRQRINGTFFVAGGIPVFVAATTHTIGFTLDAPVFQGFRPTLESIAQGRTYQASKAELKRTQADILLDSYEGYQSLLLDKARVAIEEDNLKEAESTLKDVQARFNAGVSTQFDVMQAQAQVASARQNLVAAQGQFHIRGISLANTLGLPILTELFPVETDAGPFPLVPPASSLEQLVDHAFENRPEIRRDKFLVKANQVAQWTAISPVLPRVDLVYTTQAVGFTLDKMFNTQLNQVNVNWLIERGGLGAVTQFKVLQAQTAQSKLVELDTERRVAEEVARNFYNSRNFLVQIDAVRQRVSSEREAFRLARLRLDEGFITTTDLLVNQVALNRARLDLASAVIDYNITQARLLHGIGRMTIQNVLTPMTTLVQTQSKNAAKP